MFLYLERSGQELKESCNILISESVTRCLHGVMERGKALESSESGFRCQCCKFFSAVMLNRLLTQIGFVFFHLKNGGNNIYLTGLL